VLTNEPCILRTYSYSISGHENSFREGIRNRDKKCVLSGVLNLNADFGDWRGFQSARIFPLHKESLFIGDNFGRWITDLDNEPGVSRINSCQNGFLLRSDLLTLFDSFLVCINPDVSKSTANLFLMPTNFDLKVGIKFQCSMPIPLVSTVEYWILSVVIRQTPTTYPTSYFGGTSDSACLRT
jgi:HNH endonuclease